MPPKVWLVLLGDPGAGEFPRSEPVWGEPGSPGFLRKLSGEISGRGRDSALAARICGRLKADAEIVLVPGGSILGVAGDAVRDCWN